MDCFNEAKASYGTELAITRKNISEEDKVCFTKTEGKITINAATAEDSTKKMELILSGYFNGQIVNNVEKLVITLNQVCLENTDESVIVGNKKTQISAKKDTVNYLISKGNAAEKTGAIKTEKNINLECGGSGTCVIIDERCHGIKADKVEFKGSGKYFIQGSSDGSAVNCNKFVIEAAEEGSTDKTVSLCLYKAKNGIKADKSIDIKAGSIYFYNTTTALKTDVAKEGAEKTTTINLDACAISLKNVSKIYETDTYTKGEKASVSEM